MERMRGGKERWSPPPGGLPGCRKRLHQECKVQGLSPAGVMLGRNSKRQTVKGRRGACGRQASSRVAAGSAAEWQRSTRAAASWHRAWRRCRC